jgi:hypothetical protein
MKERTILKFKFSVMDKVKFGFWATENVLFREETRKLLKKHHHLLLLLKLYKKFMTLPEDSLPRSNIKVLEPWSLLSVTKLKISFF